MTALEQGQVVFRAIAESMLGVLHGFIFKAAAAIQNRQQGDRHSRFGSRVQKPRRHLAVVVIGFAVWLMMQVVKFCNGCISFLQHVDVQIPGDGLQLLGIKAGVGAVHQFTPTPEIILPRDTMLGQPGKNFLMGVGMQVGNASNDGTFKTQIDSRIVIFSDTLNSARRIKFNNAIALPA